MKLYIAAFLTILVLVKAQGQVVLEMPLPDLYAGVPTPIIQRGLLMSRQKDFPGLIVRRFPAQDSMAVKIDVAPDRLQITGSAVGNQGQLALIGRLFSNTGSTSVLILAHESGNSSKVIILENFGPGAVAILESGEVILAGREVNPDNSTVVGGSSIRLYSKSGQLSKKGLDADLMTAVSNGGIPRIFIFESGQEIIVLTTAAEKVFRLDQRLVKLSEQPLPLKFLSAPPHFCANVNDQIYCENIDRSAEGRVITMLNSKSLVLRTIEYRSLGIHPADYAAFAGVDNGNLVFRFKGKQSLVWINKPEDR